MLNPNYVHTITLYNCLRAADNLTGKDIWYRRVLDSCFYKAKMETVQDGTGIKRVNTHAVRIPEDPMWKSYREWVALTDDERRNYFTTNNGDLVVYGESAEEITSCSPNTAAQVLERNLPDAFRVTAVSINTGHRAGRHYRLEG